MELSAKSTMSTIRNVNNAYIIGISIMSVSISISISTSIITYAGKAEVADKKT